MGLLNEHRKSGGELTVEELPKPEPPRAATWPVLDRKALLGLAGELVGTLEPHTEADPVAVLLQFLVAFGSSAGRSPHFLVEGDRHHTNLFAVLVGTTAKGRKGTSWGRTKQVMEAADPTWTQSRVASGLSSGEGLIWAVRDPIYTFNARTEEEELTDPGVRDKRLLVQEAEFASTLKVLGREGSTLSAVIRNAWDTGSLKALTKNSPATATEAHISIIGHITKEELRRYLDATETANGFANRFLWACVRRSKCLPEGGQLTEGALSSLISHVRSSLEAARLVGRMTRSPAARSLWAAVYERLSDGQPGLFGAVTSRAEAQVARVSCVYALLDGKAVIDTEHLEAALALWAYSEASCRFIFGDSLGDQVSDTILAELRQRPRGLSRTEISELLGRHQRAPAIDRALRLLEECGLAAPMTVPSGGRPVQRWVANAKEAKEAKKGVALESRP